ncbi:MAG: formylglycine-generating enzyme family protein [Verrucomicrobiales bacterium]|nr:formylglycine-generating enzyme family protein [Verrucomicrobiales bacterium]
MSCVVARALASWVCLAGILHSAELTISNPLAPRLQVQGPVSTTQAILWTDNLADAGGVRWRVLTNLSITAGTPREVLVDPAQTGHRFYRAFEVPTNFVWLPPATFLAGSPPTEAERDVEFREIQHQVTLTRGVWMAQFEVTQALYAELTGRTQSTFRGPSLPMESVSWHEATNFCGLLTQREQAAGRLPQGLVYRLPTESEWEYGCRAGTTTAFSFGPALRAGMARFNTQEEYDEATGTKFGAPDPLPMGPVPVGSYQPNAFGLHDMHGNVSEWCADGYDDYSVDPIVDPQGVLDHSHVAVRGGAWDVGGRICRSARRYAGVPEHAHYAIGFRIALSPLP